MSVTATRVTVPFGRGRHEPTAHRDRPGRRPDAWAAAGFTVVGGAVLLGSTARAADRLGRTCSRAGRSTASTTRSTAWPATPPRTPPADRRRPRDTRPTRPHPNGIARIDHVVVRSGDRDRTVAAFERAGLEVRGGRSTDQLRVPDAPDVPVGRRRHHRAGRRPTTENRRTDEPTSIFGLALVADDLDVTAASPGRPAGHSQGRRCSTGGGSPACAGAEVGISLPIAVMSPHV